MQNAALSHADTLGFPFGRPLAPCEPDVTEPRPVLVLGGWARPVAVRWTRPYGDDVEALPVDTEPVPFWDGADAPLRVRRWQRDVGFLPEWGRVEPSPANGTDGRWLARDVLDPLGLAPADAWSAYAVPFVGLPLRRLCAVEDAFYEFSRAAALPPLKPYLLQRSRRHAAFVARNRADALAHLLATADPELVVTVGAFAEAVFCTYAVDAAVATGRPLGCTHDGPVVTLDLAERRVRWVALSRHDRSAVTRRVMREASLRLG
jgi:hypothetical protein